MTKKIISVILIIVTLTVLEMQQSFAVTNAEKRTNIYVDGIKFEIYMDDENIVVASNEKNGNSKMIIDPEGNAEIYINDSNGNGQKLTMKINDLTDEKIMISVRGGNGEIIQFNSIEDLESDEYIGQVALTIGIGTVVGSLLSAAVTALLISAAVVVIGGVTYTALDYALQKVKVRYNSYYRAYRRNNVVLVSTSSISFNTAVARIRTRQDIYTYYQSNARSVVAAAGLGVIGPEIDSRTSSSGWLKRGIYYYHYHPGNRSCHAFFGKAYVY